MEVLSRYTSGKWNETQKNYSTIKKEIIYIVECISDFQEDLLNQFFLLRIDYKATKDVIENDVKNIVSKQIFARRKAIISVFDFDIEYIKGELNYLSDFLTRELLQGL